VFTGIVEELGTIAAVEGDGDGLQLQIEAPALAALSHVGDSINVSGCCLTVVAVRGSTLSFEVVPESLRRTALGRLAPGSAVNLEDALRAGEPYGGHIVQGHVDGVGRIRRVDDEGIEVEAPQAVLRYCVEKGSIALEGVSLTIARLGESSFTVALIAHTREVTTLGGVAEGDDVNLEVDVVAKYVERLAAR